MGPGGGLDAPEAERAAANLSQPEKWELVGKSLASSRAADPAGAVTSSSESLAASRQALMCSLQAQTVGSPLTLGHPQSGVHETSAHMGWLVNP